MKTLEQLKKEIAQQLEKQASLQELDALYRRYLGRKGEISLRFKKLAFVSPHVRKKEGAVLNSLKKELGKLFDQKIKMFKEKEGGGRFDKEWLDVTAPGLDMAQGRLHPLTHLMWEIERIFMSFGFSVVEGPQMEDEWHNFDALNIPTDHPARDMWDTFWLKGTRRKK